MDKANRAYRYLRRAFVFVVVLVVALWGINSFLQPIWFYENNYHTYRSFYEEPRDTIETVFVGASMTLFGLSPMEMYAQNGICSYNLASSSQPIIMSYYWTKEAHRLHNGTMDTVVLDVSMLRRKSTEEDYRKALDGMASDSPVKKEAIQSLTNGPIEYLSYQFPMFGYHDRWASVNYTDFVKYGTELEDYARGYFMEFSKIFDQYDAQSIPVPTQIINPDAEPSTFENESLYYFNKLADFCKENGIKLVLCKTPSPSNWSSGDHNGVQELADAYDLDFLDLEIEPALSELEYCPPLDSKDLDKHLNYYGAAKLSSWMGNYLAQNCGNRDVRGDERYAFMDRQLENYVRKVVQMAEATKSVDVADYLQKVITGDNYTVMIAVKDDATVNLTTAQRMAFAQLGLSKLATLQFHDSYAAMVTDGTVDFETIDRSPSTFADDVEKEKKGGLAVADQTVPLDETATVSDIASISSGDWDKWEDLTAVAKPITESGTFADGTDYVIKSGGLLRGNTGSIMLNKAEYSKNQRGINIVVYDNDSHRVVDVATFDTCLSATRESRDYQASLNEALEAGTKYSRLSDNLQKLYRYNWRYTYSLEAKTLKQEVGATGLYYYLDNYCHRDGLVVMIAVKDDAADSLSDEARWALASLGLSEASKIESNDSYCAAFENGEVVEEARSNDGVPLVVERMGYTIESGGYFSGNVASIVIDEGGVPADYALNSRGFNIVVYNPKLDIVVDSACFDTCHNDVDVPAGMEKPSTKK